MKIRDLSSAEKYASALVPPKVSWRTLRKCFSPGTVSDAGIEFAEPGAWEYVTRDAEAMSKERKNAGRRIFDLDMDLIFPEFAIRSFILKNPNRAVARLL